MAEETGRRSQLGASSVRKMAIPKLMGTAISRAINEVYTVPKTGTNAPNWLCGTSQFGVVRNEKPKVWNAWKPPLNIITAAANREMSTKMPATVTAPLKKRSLRLSR